MAVNESFAQLSNNFMYSAMAVYGVALVAYAGEWGFGSRGRTASRTATAPAVAAAVSGSSGGGPPSQDSTGPPRTRTRPKDGGEQGGPARPDRHLAHRAGLRPALRRRDLPRAVRRSGAVGQHVRVLHRSALAVTGGVPGPAHPVRRPLARRLWCGAPVLLTLGLAVTVLYTDRDRSSRRCSPTGSPSTSRPRSCPPAVFTVGPLATVLFLIAERHARRRSGAALGRLPSAAGWIGSPTGVHAFAFPLWTFADHGRGDLGGERLGAVLGLGPEGDVVVHHLGGVRRVSARPGDRGLARPARGGDRPGRLPALLFNYIGVNIWITGLHSYA